MSDSVVKPQDESTITGKIPTSTMIQHIVASTGVPKNNVKAVIKAMTEFITAALTEGAAVAIDDLAIFRTDIREPRQGRNIKTGEVLQVPRLQIARVKVSPVLKKAVRKPV